MRGEKTVTFDFAFTYSDKGHFVEAREITVRAPGLSKLRVHNTMKSYVARAVPGIMDVASKFRSANAGQEPDESASSPQDGSEADEQDVLALMAMGMSVADYNDFIMFVKGALTNSDLAYIGDGKRPVTDEVWESIADKGGMDAVNKLMSDFTGFFFEALGGTSKPPSGNNSATTSGSQPPAISPTKPRALSRLKS